MKLKFRFHVLTKKDNKILKKDISYNNIVVV
jgi:hypothetical protein